jgi:transmembrane sensor
MMAETLDFDSPFGADLWEVLGRYVSNESPPAEAEAVRAWLAADPSRERLVRELDAVTRRLSLAPRPQAESQAAWRKFAARLDDPVVKPIRPRLRLNVALRVAAALLLLLGGGIIWKALQRHPAAQPPSIATTGPTIRTYGTAVGKTDSIQLDDGSRVVLGPASHLTLPAGFGTVSRQADLVGEALFDVVHDASHPFTVRVGSAVVEDLGTTFAIRQDGQEVRVTVTAGSVRLRDSVSSGVVELKAGDRGTRTGEGKVIAERSVRTADDLAWTRGRLVFNAAEMPLVKADLARWYGVHLEFADPALASRHLSAVFAGEPVDAVLRMVALALGADIERRGDTAFVRARQ